MWMCGMSEGIVARQLNIDPRCLWFALVSPEWALIVDTLRDSILKHTGNRMQRLSQRCFDLLEERLEGGDPVYDLEHNIVGYRAIRARDLSNMMAQLVDRQNTLDRTGRNNQDKGERPLTLKDLATLLEEKTKLKRFNEAREINPEQGTVQ